MNRSTTSPLRPSERRPNVGTTNEPLQHIVRTLERQNNQLVEQIRDLRTQLHRVGQLEEKIQLVLRHNTQLLNENERLAKLINQKKSETELWKNKFQTVTNNKNASTDLEIKRLLNEIQKLKQQNCEIEHVKNVQLNELKNQNHLQIQNIKRLNLSSAEKYELQIRKLKEYCDKKQYELSQLNMKYVRLNKETDFEISKLREEKERLKNDLIYEESQHKREIDSMKSKFDYNFHSEIQNLKKQHLNQIEALDYENSKLKEVINSKNNEIQQIFTKNSKVKNNYEESIILLQKENDDLKDKIVETQQIAQLQLNNLRDKLDGIKQSEIAMLRAGHSNQIDLLTQEIRKLQQILDDRNAQIQNIVKERNQARINYETDLIKANAQLESTIVDKRQAQARHEQARNVFDSDYKAKEQQMRTMQNFLQSQINTLKGQRESLSNQLDTKENELERQRQQSNKFKRKMQQQINTLKQKVNNYRQDIDRNSRKSSTEFQEAKKHFEIKTKQLQTKINSLQDENKQKENLINELKSSIKQLETQIKNADDKINILENCEKNLRKQAREALFRWDAKQKEYNNLIAEQNKIMENARKREIQELKQIQNNKINTMKHQLKQYQKQIDNKNKLLNELKSKYEDLVNKFEEVFSQRAAQKNLDLKIPGWLPQTLATKSLFDVFIKNKVLQYCS